MSFSPDVLAHARLAAAPDFLDHLRALAAAGDPAIERWSRVCDEEAGLEIWACRLAAMDRTAGIAAAAAAARHVLPTVLERAGDQALECGISEDAESVDGAPEAVKVALVTAWLAAPGDDTRAAVEEAIDPSRQLEVWDDDLYPSDDVAWQWFTGVGQLCAASVTVDDGDATGPFPDSSYEWPARVCIARCIVAAAKCLRNEDGDALPGIAAVARAVGAAF